MYKLVILVIGVIVLNSCEPEPCYDNQGFEISCYEVSH